MKIHRKFINRKIGVLSSILLGAAFFVGCSGKGPEPDAPKVPETQIQPVAADDAETWSIYWYFCGSDLESKLGAGTDDLNEMFSVKLPDNVRVIFETGGAMEWATQGVDPEKQTRFCYDNSGLNKIEEVEGANMGEADTLQSFLEFCVDKYPADHQMVIFWDHGGGVLGGVSYDENYFMESLSLPDLTTVFDNICEGKSEPVFDIVGFDACLMATVDTAKTICDEATYMIASQELEPGNGWNYTGIFGAFAENPKITADELGQKICDTFMEGCKEHETQYEATLSMVELEKTKKLFELYDQFGDALLMESVDNEGVFAAAGRAAYDAEHYGQNSNDEGFTNMVDLGMMVENIDFLPEGLIEELQSALDECVSYEVRGDYKQYGSGLSIYYPLDNSLRSVIEYEQKSDFMSYQSFYHYQVAGNLTDDAKSYIETRSVNLDAYSDDAELETMEKVGVVDEPMTMDEQGEIEMEIGGRAGCITSIHTMISTIDKETGNVMIIGAVPVEFMDFESGFFKGGAKDVWWFLNGHLVHMKPVEIRDKYTIYTTPVMYEGEKLFLRFAEDHPSGNLKFIGARRPLYENYMPDKQLHFLHKGDEITTLMVLGAFDEIHTDEMELSEYETFTFDDEPELHLEKLPEGIYDICFVMNDVWRDQEYSVIRSYRVDKDGNFKPAAKGESVASVIKANSRGNRGSGTGGGRGDGTGGGNRTGAAAAGNNQAADIAANAGGPGQVGLTPVNPIAPYETAANPTADNVPETAASGGTSRQEPETNSWYYDDDDDDDDDDWYWQDNNDDDDSSSNNAGDQSASNESKDDTTNGNNTSNNTDTSANDNQTVDNDLTSNGQDTSENQDLTAGGQESNSNSENTGNDNNTNNKPTYEIVTNGNDTINWGDYVNTLP